MTEYDMLLYRIKRKLDQFNVIVQGVPKEEREYEEFLDCYAQDIYEMCKKFYETNVRRVSE